jgi:CRISPR-associated endonuclease Cas2
MTTFVIGYDIKDPKRLQQVHRVLKNYAMPIEYSIFLLDGDKRAAQRCMQALLPLIDPKQDDLRCYPLPLRGWQARLGIGAMPEGIFWTGLPAALT